MFALLTYPMDVIKTNRILQTTLSRENGESLNREFLSLYEKGGLQKGLYRGFLLAFLAANAQGPLYNSRPQGDAFLGILFTLIHNPLQILQVHKQVVHRDGRTPSYATILKQYSGNPTRLFTLGLIPSLLRNVILCAGFLP